MQANQSQKKASSTAIKNYFNRLDGQGFIQFLKEGAWFQFWWLTMINIGNIISSTTIDSFFGPIHIKDLDPRFNKGFLTHMASICQKSLDILLPISDALLVLGLALESTFFYQSKNKNLKLTANLLVSLIAGSLIIAASIVTAPTMAAWLFLSAVAIKGGQSLIATGIYSYQLMRTGNQDYLRPLIHQFLALATTAVTFSALYYLVILIPAAAAGPAGLATVAAVATLYTVASKLALAASALMLTTLMAKACDEFIVRPWQKNKAENKKEVKLNAPKYQYTLNQDPQLAKREDNGLKATIKHEGIYFFQQAHRKDAIENLQLDKARTYLLSELDLKIDRLLASQQKDQTFSIYSVIEKTFNKPEDRQHKINLLIKLKNAIEDNALNDENIESIINDKTYYKAERSFFREVSDTKDLIDAIKEFVNTHSSQLKETSTHLLDNV